MFRSVLTENNNKKINMAGAKQKKSEIKSCIQECLNDAAFMDLFAAKIAEMVSGKLAERINSLEEKLAVVQAENEGLINRIDDLEQGAKLTQLRMYGVPEANNENLKDKVQLIIDRTLQLPDCHLEHCFRIGVKEHNASKPRPVLVKFPSTAQRNQVFFNKKKLKGSKLVIVEDLTKVRHDLLQSVREKVETQNVWTRDGRIYIKLQNKKHCIRNNDELVALLESE